MTSRCAHCGDKFSFKFKRAVRMYCSHACCATASWHRVQQRRNWRANQAALLMKAGLPVPERLRRANA